ncbi:MAG: hypothetical protein ACLFUT_09560, partial [Desulfobacteraceae bacterium]
MPAYLLSQDMVSYAADRAAAAPPHRDLHKSTLISTGYKNINGMIHYCLMNAVSMHSQKTPFEKSKLILLILKHPATNG